MPNESYPHILIVEDERDLRELLIELLPHYQLSADGAANAQQALQLLAQSENNYVAVIIDLGLPGMDGCELVKILRSQPATQNLPCIAMTSWHTAAYKERAMEAGFNAYFAKPFLFETIVNDLKAVIGLS